MKRFLQFIIIFIIAFGIDITIGFSMTLIVQEIGYPTYTILVIDEIISFPLTLWNKIFPAWGIYRETSPYFWGILVINALFQALFFVLIRWSIRKMRYKKA